MRKKGKIFVSSTFSEFEEERRELFGELRSHYFDTWDEQLKGAGQGTNENLCKDGVDWANLIVCLVGEQFGEVYRSHPRQSIVQWEIEYSQQQNKPIYFYVKDTLKDKSALHLKKLDSDQRSFIDAATDFKGGHRHAFFGSTVALVQNALRDLGTWAYNRLDDERILLELINKKIITAVAFIAICLFCLVITSTSISSIPLILVPGTPRFYAFSILMAGIAIVGLTWSFNPARRNLNHG